MTKSELIAHLAGANPHLRLPDIELIVATIFNEITEALARGPGGTARLRRLLDQDARPAHRP
jgi:nucleoid DNA-binding protein